MDNSKSFINTRNIILIILVVILSIFVYQIKDITLLFFTSFIVASALNRAVDRMSKKMPRGIAVLLIYLLGLIFMTLVLVPLVNILVSQFVAFLQHSPIYWAEANKLLNKLMIMGKGMGLKLNFSQVLSNSINVSNNFVNSSINITLGLLAGLAVIFTLALIVLYMLLDKQRLKASYLRFFPPDLREKAEKISGNISKKVGGYVIGQLLSMVIVAVMTALGLLIIRVEFALLLGIIAGILDILPVVGPIIAAVLGILAAFSQKPIMALWALLIYLFVQWITNTIFKPMIFSKFLDLHPLVIIFSLLVAANFLGIIGVIIAPAIAATVCILIEELYLEKINH